jgi:uncharacterized membrane protein
MADPKEIVEAQTVLQAVGTTSVQPTFVQRAGLWLAAGVGALIAVVTLCVLGFLYVYYPSMPPAESLKDAAVAKETLANYKELSGIAIKSAQDIFTTIVVSALLPVLTAILGYIFGRGGKDDGGQ